MSTLGTNYGISELRIAYALEDAINHYLVDQTMPNEGTLYGISEKRLAIAIAENTSISGGSATWGAITGNLASQSDLSTALSLKQNALGYTAENTANKSDSYTVSSSITYATTKAVVDGLATKQDTIIGGITGSGASNQIAFWNGTNTQTGSSNLTWDGANFITNQVKIAPFATYQGNKSVSCDVDIAGNAITITASDQTTQTFTATNHGASTGDHYIMNVVGSIGGGGFAANQQVWIIKVDNNTIKLSNSYSNALANINYPPFTGTGVLGTPAQLTRVVSFRINPLAFGSVYFGGQYDGTVANGNKRGFASIDFQAQRVASNQVAAGDRSALIGGHSNLIGVAAAYSFIGGGSSNSAIGGASAIVGGEFHLSSGLKSFIAGGQSNTASGSYSRVLSYNSTASGSDSFVLGGRSYTVSGTASGIIGLSNASSGTVATDNTLGILGGVVLINNITQPTLPVLKLIANVSQSSNIAEINNSAGAVLSVLVKADGSYQPVSLTSAASANSSLFYSTTLSRLAYKDSSGNIFAQNQRQFSTKTANYTLTIADDYVRFNGASLTATLPNATTMSGHEFEIKNVNSTALTINTTSSQLMDSNLTVSLSQYEVLKVVSNGTNWDII